MLKLHDNYLKIYVGLHVYIFAYYLPYVLYKTYIYSSCCTQA